MIPPLHATKPDALAEKVHRRRVLIGELVELEQELLAAGVISRRVVLTRTVVHETRRYTASLDGRHDLD